MFFFNDTSTTEIYTYLHTLSLHYALPIYGEVPRPTDAMMDSFDVILIDLQDLGCRIYTFITTLLYILEAAASHGKSRSEEHTSELQSLMRNSYAVFCLKNKTKKTII